MERCPVCRARLRGEWLCPRCGSDLSLPVKIAQRVRQLEQRAVMRLAVGDKERAEAALLEASRLQSTQLARALLRFLQEHQ
jgi:hypothetical protein